MYALNPTFNPGRFGGPFPVWLLNKGMIQKFVDENGIKPVADEPVPVKINRIHGVSDEAAQEVFRLTLGTRGGIRGPHLHLDGQLYLLDAGTWSRFTEQMISVFREQLDGAGSISFEQFMEIGEAIGTVAGTPIHPGPAS